MCIPLKWGNLLNMEFYLPNMLQINGCSLQYFFLNCEFFRVLPAKNRCFHFRTGILKVKINSRSGCFWRDYDTIFQMAGSLKVKDLYWQPSKWGMQKVMIFVPMLISMTSYGVTIPWNGSYLLMMLAFTGRLGVVLSLLLTLKLKVERNENASSYLNIIVMPQNVPKP